MQIHSFSKPDRLARKALLSLCLTGLALISTSCGWVLYGTATDETIALSQLEFESNFSTGLSRILERAFSGNSNAEDDEYLVSLVNEIQTERVQSLTAGLRSNQLRMEKRVQYRISAIHGGRVETGTALVWRDLDMDEFTPGATEREKSLLQEEIDEEIVQQILNHLERFEINNAGDIQARLNATQS